jgi:outer membrane autotransporter protein
MVLIAESTADNLAPGSAASRLSNGPWVDVRGGFGDVDGDNAATVDYDNYGVYGGYDWVIGNDDAATVGVTLGYLRTNFDSDNPGADGNIDTFNIGAYGSYVLDNWVFTSGVSFGYNDFETSRVALGQDIDADYDGFTISARGGASYVFEIGAEKDLLLEPFGQVEYLYSETDDFTEDGGVLALDVDSADYDALFLTVGSRLYKSFAVSDWTLTPEARLGVQFEVLDSDTSSSASFIGFGTPFAVEGADTPDLSALAGLGLSAVTSNGLVLRGDYNGRFSDDQTDHQFSLAIQLPF